MPERQQSPTDKKTKHGKNPAGKLRAFVRSISFQGSLRARQRNASMELSAVENPSIEPAQPETNNLASRRDDRMSNSAGSDVSPVSSMSVDSYSTLCSTVEYNDLSDSQNYFDEVRLHRRALVLNEVIDTERVYVKALNELTRYYKVPLSNVMPADDFQEVFSDLSALHEAHSCFLARLECKAALEDPAVGDEFLCMTTFLRTYSRYINNYLTVIQTLTRFESTDDGRQLLARLTSDCTHSGGKTIYAYLLIPIHRIARYLYLLDDLRKKTGLDHSDYASLVESLAILSTVADYIDEIRSACYESQKMAALSLLVRSVPMGSEIIAPNRSFIFDGELCINISESFNCCLLFNDVLYITAPIQIRNARRKARPLSQSGRQDVCSTSAELWSSEGALDEQCKESSYIAHIKLSEARLLRTAEMFCLIANNGDVYHFHPPSDAMCETWVSLISKAKSIVMPAVLSINEIPLPTLDKIAIRFAQSRRRSSVCFSVLNFLSTRPPPSSPRNSMCSFSAEVTSDACSALPGSLRYALDNAVLRSSTYD